MSGHKEFYQLSLEADQDIDDIFDYTDREFGFNQAVDYVQGFDGLFQKLLLNPELGKARDEIKPGLRSIPKDEHIVFYRVMENHIRIVRVLHGSRDLPSLF